LKALYTSGIALVHAMRRVRKELGQEHRYAHTLRVARFAERLARAHGENAAQARVAGLFHDLARLYSAPRLLEECAARGMPIDAFERANPIVLHARLGAELARDQFGVDDEAVLSAIRKHTVGDAQMSRLDRIVFLADGLEPGRDFRARPAYADLSMRDLDGAMRAVLASSVTYLRKRDLAIAPQTRAAAAAFGLAAASVSGRYLETDTTPETRAVAAGGPPLADTASPNPAFGLAGPPVGPARRTPRKGSKLPDLLTTVREAAEDKKGEDFTLLDLDGRTIVADTFVLVTGRSKIQTRSIADAIVEAVREAGFRVARTEGYGDGGWILIDLGSVVVHVFTPEQRQFYNLERLWGRPAEARAQSS
jgi:ribosome silencing factor RsfS/YbeB/iojap